MQAAMDRLSGILERRRWLVVSAWLLLLVAALPFAARQTEDLTSGGFAVPGSGSEAVDRSLDRFERAEGETLAVVLAREPGADAADMRAQVDRVGAVAADLDNVELSPGAAARAKRQAGEASIVVVPLQVDGIMDEVADLAVAFRADMGTEVRRGVQPYFVGQAALWAGMQDLSKEDLEQAEMTGFPIVFLILLAVFGSLAAAALPLALGLFSVMITGAVIFFLSQVTGMSVFVTNVASMIGIGVAVDYSLFVLARYRQEIKAGAEPIEARRISLRTSGLAVAFSGLTVVIALAGLFLVDSKTIQSMALGAIVVVAISVVGALTLLPVLMRLFGRRVYTPGWSGRAVAAVWGRLRRRPAGDASRGLAPPDPRGAWPARGEPAAASGGGDFWQRWTDLLMRRPLLFGGAAAAILLVLAIPALSLQFGDGALRQFPAGHETRVGAEIAAKELGPGAMAPAEVLAELRSGKVSDPENRRALAEYVAAVKRDPDVAGVAPLRPASDGRAALIAVESRYDGESPEAEALLERLRDGTAGGGALNGVARVEVGGATASVEDFKNLVAGSMWKILVFVLLFSYLVLLVLLRSVLLPLKAVIMNLLSVGAAYGVLVAVFQWGWLDGVLGYESLGYVNTMTPPFLLAIVFGLSMDYEVFMLSRIRERYDATGDTATAVGQGLRATAMTISSAALIMVAVFAVFAGTGVPSVKEIGLGLAVAIALDATLVRLILVPATMKVMGRWNWWLPRPLARILPRAAFEASGAGAERAPARA